jgi:hypothetical protein
MSNIKLTNRSLLSLSIVTVLYGNNALAVSQQDNVYVKSTIGMTALESKHSEKKLKNNDFLTNDNLSGGFAIGKRYYNIGVELGYTTMGKQTYYSHKTLHTNNYYNQNFSLDLNSYYDLIQNLEFKTALGLGMLHTKTRVTHSHINDNSRAEIRGRAGLGFTYNFTKLINANYDLLIQGGNKDFQSHFSNNLSIRYNFM